MRLSGFEHYQQELTALDHEIRPYAAVCGVALESQGAVDNFLQRQHENPAADRGRETLQGLLVLRIRLETEMLEVGITAPPLVQPVAD